MPKDVHCTKQHGFLLNASHFYRGTVTGGGGGGAQSLPTMIFFFFACQHRCQSCTFMMIVPQPHCENFATTFFRLENVLDSPPPPPPPRQAGGAVSRHFATPNQTPWHRPCVYIYRKGTSIRQAPVFRLLRALRKKPMEVYYLDEWIRITLHVLVSYIQQYFNTSITVLTNQVWKLLIAPFKVPNTGAITVLGQWSSTVRPQLSGHIGTSTYPEISDLAGCGNSA